jgi:hypothetical protein
VSSWTFASELFAARRNFGSWFTRTEQITIGDLGGSGAIEFFADVADGSTPLEQSSEIGALKIGSPSVMMCDQPKK